MRYALDEAHKARERGDRPIGCVIVHDGEIVSRGGNRVYSDDSEFEHAEIVALRSNAEYILKHSDQCVLYTTLEPCVMCLGTIVLANIHSVVYGAPDPARGGTAMYEKVEYVQQSLHDYIGGVLKEECKAIRFAGAKSCGVDIGCG